MLDNPENRKTPQGESIFIDWGPYTTPDVIAQLPGNFRYTQPKPDGELRERISRIEGSLNGLEKEWLRISLKFLEQGIIEDDYGGNEPLRNHVLKTTTINVGGEQIFLSDFAHKVSKLSVGSMSWVVSIGTASDNRAIKRESARLAKWIRGRRTGEDFLVPSDLKPVDALTRKMVNHILSGHEKGR